MDNILDSLNQLNPKSSNKIKNSGISQQNREQLPDLQKRSIDFQIESTDNFQNDHIHLHNQSKNLRNSSPYIYRKTKIATPGILQISHSPLGIKDQHLIDITGNKSVKSSSKPSNYSPEHYPTENLSPQRCSTAKDSFAKDSLRKANLKNKIIFNKNSRAKSTSPSPFVIRTNKKKKEFNSPLLIDYNKKAEFIQDFAKEATENSMFESKMINDQEILVIRPRPKTSYIGQNTFAFSSNSFASISDPEKPKIGIKSIEEKRIQSIIDAIKIKMSSTDHQIALEIERISKKQQPFYRMFKLNIVKKDYIKLKELHKYKKGVEEIIKERQSSLELDLLNKKLFKVKPKSKVLIQQKEDDYISNRKFDFDKFKKDNNISLAKYVKCFERSTWKNIIESGINSDISIYEDENANKILKKFDQCYSFMNKKKINISKTPFLTQSMIQNKSNLSEIEEKSQENASRRQNPILIIEELEDSKSTKNKLSKIRNFLNKSNQ